MSFYRMIKPEWSIPELANGEKNPKFIKEIPGKKTIEGCLEKEEVFRLNNLGYNAYWFPNHPSSDVYKAGTRHLSGKMIDVFNYVFVDMDSKDGVYTVDEFLDVLKDFSVKPTLTVKSGNGIHAYWKVDELSREDYVVTQLSLLKYLKTDQSVWTVLQLMRVPGTLNTKNYDNFKKTKIVESLSSGKSISSINEFPKEIFNLSENEKTKVQNHINKLDGKVQMNLSEDVNIDELPDKFISLMSENESIYQLFNNPKQYYKDRSSADMKLTHLLMKEEFSKKEAMQVISNTEKALSKGNSRIEYAHTTIDKAYVNTCKNQFQSVSQKLKNGLHTIERKLVKGPKYFDCLVKGWCKKQVLGLVGGSGIGKTAVTLKIFKDMLQNNLEENDDIFVFFSLEMPESEIIERWVELVGDNSPLADRLYVIGNEDDNDEPRNIGLQEIYQYCMDLKKQTGRDIGSIGIDHVGILGLHIDIRKKHTFGVDGEQGTGSGLIQTISLKNAVTQVKSLAKMLNCFIVLLTQTTKAKGVGYLPLEKDAGFGVSQYENIVDYMITLWQPLQLVQDLTETRFLAWQYAKIRHQHRNDPIKPNSYKLLVYNMDNGELQPPSEEEYLSFKELLPQAQEVIKQKEKKTETAYSRTISPEALKDIDAKLRLIHDKK